MKPLLPAKFNEFTMEINEYLYKMDCLVIKWNGLIDSFFVSLFLCNKCWAIFTTSRMRKDGLSWISIGWSVTKGFLIINLFLMVSVRFQVISIFQIRSNKILYLSCFWMFVYIGHRLISTNISVVTYYGLKTPQGQTRIGLGPTWSDSLSTSGRDKVHRVNWRTTMPILERQTPLHSWKLAPLYRKPMKSVHFGETVT